MSLFKKLMVWLGVFTGIISGLLLIAYFNSSFYTAGLKTPIENQLNAITARDTSLAYSFTSESYQAKTTFKNFEKFINKYSGLRNNDGISYQNREVSQGVGIVNATLISSGGSETTIRYQLVKEGDQWRISDMAINPGEQNHSIDSHAIAQ